MKLTEHNVTMSLIILCMVGLLISLALNISKKPDVTPVETTKTKVVTLTCIKDNVNGCLVYESRESYVNKSTGYIK